MSIIDDKKNILTQIGSLNSIVSGDSDLPEFDSNLLSINNDNEIVPFLIDILTVVVGSESLQTALGEIITNFIRDIETDLKEELKKQFVDFNSDESLPSLFINNGYEINLTDIDIFNKLKNDPSSDIGNLLYGGNANNLDRKIYESLVTEGTEIVTDNLKIVYSKLTNSINIKPVNSLITIGEFTEQLIDEFDLVNENEIVTKLLDSFFGVLSKNENKTIDQLVVEEKVHRTVNKVVQKKDSLDISDSELKELEENAKTKFLGVNNLDVGCATLNTNLQLSAVTNLLNTITGTTDPLTVGNEFNNLLFNSFTGNSETTSNNNEQPIKDGFFKKIINFIINQLLEAITITPQIRILFGLTSGFKNNNIPQLNDPLDDLKNNRKIINCLFIKIEKLLNEFIFNLVKKELLKLIVPISKLILKEKANQYVGIIKSLVNII